MDVDHSHFGVKSSLPARPAAPSKKPNLEWSMEVEQAQRTKRRANIPTSPDKACQPVPKRANSDTTPDESRPVASSYMDKSRPLPPIIFSGSAKTSLIPFLKAIQTVTGPLDIAPNGAAQLSRGDFLLRPASLTVFNTLSAFIEDPAPLFEACGNGIKANLPASVQRDQHPKTSQPKTPAVEHAVMARNVPFALGQDADLLEDLKTNSRYQGQTETFLSVSRVISAATKKPTPLVRIQVSSAQLAKRLINEGVALAYCVFQCEEVHTRPEPKRCARCQTWGQHDARHCRGPEICLRCGEQHSLDKCPTARDKPKCPNCKGDHAAVYKGCPAFKAARDKMMQTQQQPPAQPAPARKERTGTPPGSYAEAVRPRPAIPTVVQQQPRLPPKPRSRLPTRRDRRRLRKPRTPAPYTPPPAPETRSEAKSTPDLAQLIAAFLEVLRELACNNYKLNAAVITKAIAAIGPLFSGTNTSVAAVLSQLTSTPPSVTRNG